MSFGWIAIASRLCTLGRNTVARAISCQGATVQISVHSRFYASAPNLLSQEDIRKKQEEARARESEKFRLRYHTDPEFREKRLRAWREKFATDHEFREKIRQQRKKRFSTDLQFQEQESRRSSKSWLAYKLIETPEAARLRREQARYHSSIRYGIAEFKWRNRLDTRVRQNSRFRNEVEWKCHEPVLHPAKMHYRCATCGHRMQGGLKLWWRRKDSQDSSEPEKYDCFKCFATDREASTPTYFPSDLAPLPDRGPVEQPGHLDDKEKSGHGTGSTT